MPATTFDAIAPDDLKVFLDTQGIIIDRLERLERAVVGSVEREFFSTEQAAARLGWSEWTIRQACNTGRIKGDKPYGRTWRIPLAEVERIERQGGLGPSSE